MTAAARKSGNWLWIAAGVSLVLSLTPFGALALYPFKLFTTWVHECSHALMTVLVGGSVASITIDPNTSGLTQSLVPARRVPAGLVASAGYLGASLVGCLLMAATRAPRYARSILWALGACMIVTLVIWMRNLFGITVVLAWAVVLVSLARRGTGDVLRFVISLLAIQVALNAVFDIRVLFLLDRGMRSDADTMARLFLLPAWLWASAWMAASVAMLGWTVYATRAR